MSSLKLNNFNIGNLETMTLMGGVNVLESDSIVMNVAEKFAESTRNLNINWIFKGSYDKANRSSISSFRGPGIEEGLRMLEKVKSQLLNGEIKLMFDSETSSCNLVKVD